MDGLGRPPPTVRLGSIGGLAGAMVMGLVAYLIPVPGTGGKPFFIEFASQAGLGSFSAVAGWALHLSTGALVGAGIGLLVWKAPRLATASLGRGLGLGLLAGATTWLVLFVPALLYFMPHSSSNGAALGGGLVANVVFGGVFGSLFAVSHLFYLRSGEGVECEVCGRSFRDLERLKRHAAYMHVGLDMQVSCVVCRHTFDSQSEVMQHVSLVHGEPLPVVMERFRGPTR